MFVYRITPATLENSRHHFYEVPGKAFGGHLLLWQLWGSYIFLRQIILSRFNIYVVVCQNHAWILLYDYYLKPDLIFCFETVIIGRLFEWIKGGKSLKVDVSSVSQFTLSIILNYPFELIPIRLMDWWMTDWLTDRLMDWLPDLWLTDWLTDWWMTDWLTDWWMTDWLTDRPTDEWLTDWLMTEWLSDEWLTDRLTNWWMTDWLTDRLMND